MIQREDLKKISDEDRILVVIEALLRRIALVKQPFMLIGGLLTRQYLKDRTIQPVRALDLFYMERIFHRDHAYQTFTKWLIEVTELDLGDGVAFRSFRQHPIWREFEDPMIDPFLETQIGYRFINGEVNRYQEIPLNVSFNETIIVEPVSLNYQPVFGQPFTFPYVFSLSAQVALKLYQIIISPKFKALYELRYLLSHPSYDNHAFDDTLQILVDQCCLSSIVTNDRIRQLLVNDFSHLYSSLQNDFYLRICAGYKKPKKYYMEFAKDLRAVMNQVGLNEQVYDRLPKPTYRS